MNLSSDIQSYNLQTDILKTKPRTEMVYRTFEPLGLSYSSLTTHKGLITDNKLIHYLRKLELLDQNWDGEGAQKPDAFVIRETIHFVGRLYTSYPSLKVEQACPGQSGEIVIELRNGVKSLEFIFYPNKKWKYVSVGGKRPPEQGIFELKNLPKLINWLNESE